MNFPPLAVCVAGTEGWPLPQVRCSLCQCETTDIGVADWIRAAGGPLPFQPSSCRRVCRSHVDRVRNPIDLRPPGNCRTFHALLRSSDMKMHVELEPLLRKDRNADPPRQSGQRAGERIGHD